MKRAETGAERTDYRLIFVLCSILRFFSLLDRIFRRLSVTNKHV